MKSREFYIEFGGDPSDDKEVYKRYSSTTKFEPTDFSDEVIHVIEFKQYQKALDIILKLELTLAEIAPSWLPENIRKQRREALNVVKDFTNGQSNK